MSQVTQFLRDGITIKNSATVFSDGIFKVVEPTLNVSAIRQPVLNTNGTFFSQDTQTAKIRLVINANGAPMPLNFGDRVRLTLHYVGPLFGESAFSVTANAVEDGIAEFVLENWMLEVGQAIVTGYVFLTRQNGQRMDVGDFRFNVLPSFEDELFPELERFYVQRIEEVEEFHRARIQSLEDELRVLVQNLNNFFHDQQFPPSVIAGLPEHMEDMLHWLQNIDASAVVSGTLNINRLPTLRTGSISAGPAAAGNLSFGQAVPLPHIIADAFGRVTQAVTRNMNLPVLPATMPPSAHNHDASNINTGELNNARIPLQLRNNTLVWHMRISGRTAYTGSHFQMDIGTTEQAFAIHQDGRMWVNQHPVLTAAGQIVFARLPVGTTATTVAQGNHTHTPAQVGLGNVPNVNTQNAANINAGTLPFARLPVGTGASQVAAGNHSHVNLDLISGGRLRYTGSALRFNVGNAENVFAIHQNGNIETVGNLLAPHANVNLANTAPSGDHYNLSARRVGRTVAITGNAGSINLGTQNGQNVVVAILPVGMRPMNQQYANTRTLVNTSTNGIQFELVVRTNGEISVYRRHTTAGATGTTWVQTQLTFICAE